MLLDDQGSSCHIWHILSHSYNDIEGQGACQSFRRDKIVRRLHTGPFDGKLPVLHRRAPTLVDVGYNHHIRSIYTRSNRFPCLLIQYSTDFLVFCKVKHKTTLKSSQYLFWLFLREHCEIGYESTIFSQPGCQWVKHGPDDICDTVVDVVVDVVVVVFFNWRQSELVTQSISESIS